MTLTYTLDEDGTPLPTPDVVGWSRWMMAQRRRPDGGLVVTARTSVGPIIVCTDFLGTNHNWMPHGEPILWETMVRSPTGFLDYQERYSTLADALVGHQEAVAWVRAELTDTTAETETGVAPMT